MKSSIFILLVVLVALVSLDFIEAQKEKPNKYKTPPPAGICKKFPIKANGKQNPKGQCSSQLLGEVPGVSKMVSTIITLPPNGAKIPAKKSFKIRVLVSNLQTGFFSDPETDYYDVPQTLTKAGVIQGHAHVTVQKLIGKGVPDPTKFDFFQGLNERADSKGGLEAIVPGNLTKGLYRLCTMVASESHQPVVMPVAKRGSQDDCIRFSIV
ncbi:1720_t:CDS:1 [Diversispora eburnea]|uniref:1720_t:CDS:1 n=1 Tax=Diversispora eburnea TaxID=1213867 RepID=A0A9N8YU20_9GLOM|nr:1720_t:CDS:1 [Diversispora eburnea]